LASICPMIADAFANLTASSNDSGASKWANPLTVRVPTENEHLFQSKSNTHSNRKRTLVPTESEHSFQTKANGDSNRNRTPLGGVFGLA